MCLYMLLIIKRVKRSFAKLSVSNFTLILCFMSFWFRLKWCVSLLCRVDFLYFAHTHALNVGLWIYHTKLMALRKTIFIFSKIITKKKTHQKLIKIFECFSQFILFTFSCSINVRTSFAKPIKKRKSFGIVISEFCFKIPN